MNKRIQGFIIGVLIYLLVFGGATFAAEIYKQLEVTYRDIKIEIDGETVTPKDAAGNIVEPFASNGTTYLPVRAIGEALGKEVDWDNETSTVIIKDKELKKVYLYDMEMFKTPSMNHFYKNEYKGVKYLGITPPYTGVRSNSNVLNSYTDSFSYSLNGVCQKITGRIYPPFNSNHAFFKVEFLDEKGNVLYETDADKNTSSTYFEFNTEGAELLRISFECYNLDTVEKPVCAIGDLAIHTYEK